MIRKALQIGVPALLMLMAWNAFLAVNHLKQMEKTAALMRESSTIQTDVSTVLMDLANMETGQRGYLLTGDTSYLQPYTDAKGKIETHFTALRTGLSHRTEDERKQESRLETLAHSKNAEMEHTISLRQQGYRRRAFKLMDSNEGMEYMDEARGLVSSLSVAEASRFARFDSDRKASLGKAFKETLLANLCLLLFTGCMFALIRYHGRVLEQEVAQSRHDLAMRDSQLEKLTFALSNQARSNTYTIEANAALLLQNYGGFLPRQGHEYAEQIREASAEMERLRQDLVGCERANGDERAA